MRGWLNYHAAQPREKTGVEVEKQTVTVHQGQFRLYRDGDGQTCNEQIGWKGVEVWGMSDL